MEDTVTEHTWQMIPVAADHGVWFHHTLGTVALAYVNEANARADVVARSDQPIGESAACAAQAFGLEAFDADEPLALCPWHNRAGEYVAEPDDEFMTFDSRLASVGVGTDERALYAKLDRMIDRDGDRYEAAFAHADVNPPSQTADPHAVAVRLRRASGVVAETIISPCVVPETISPCDVPEPGCLRP